MSQHNSCKIQKTQKGVLREGLSVEQVGDEADRLQENRETEGLPAQKQGPGEDLLQPHAAHHPHRGPDVPGLRGPHPPAQVLHGFLKLYFRVKLLRNLKLFFGFLKLLANLKLF